MNSLISKIYTYFILPNTNEKGHITGYLLFLRVIAHFFDLSRKTYVVLAPGKMDAFFSQRILLRFK